MKPTIGGKYIVTKTIHNLIKSQYVTIDYAYDDNMDIIFILLLIMNRKQKEKSTHLYLPNELWNVICKSVYIPHFYSYSYGLVGFHEGYCRQDEIRELTAEEKQISIEGIYTYKLPQQFYQSI